MELHALDRIGVRMAEIDTVDESWAAAMAGSRDGFAGDAVDGENIGGVDGDARDSEDKGFRRGVGLAVGRRLRRDANKDQRQVEAACALELLATDVGFPAALTENE